MNPLRVGILGCGSYANRHAQLLRTLPEQAELVAFSDRNEWKARAFADQYTDGRGAVFTDHHALLDQTDLDVLVIALPPYGHTDEVELAAERGIHLLIEKPIALTSEQGWRMVEAAERAGIKTQVGFMFRFGEAVETLQAMIASGEAGRPGLMSARYFCNALHADWWRDRARSGGQVVEQAIHLFDLMRFFLGDAATVYGRQENLFHGETPGYTSEDVSATVVSFRSGALGVVYASNGAIPGRWIADYQVVTQSITAEFTDANRATFNFTDAPDHAPQVIASDRDFRLALLRDLLDAIRTNGSTRNPLREGAKTLDLVLGAAQSNAERAEIRL